MLTRTCAVNDAVYDVTHDLQALCLPSCNSACIALLPAFSESVEIKKVARENSGHVMPNFFF